MEYTHLHTKDRTVTVDSVTFTWGENHLAFKNDVTALSEGFLVDLDFSIESRLRPYSELCPPRKIQVFLKCRNSSPWIGNFIGIHYWRGFSPS
jgi:hypothetical protein